MKKDIILLRIVDLADGRWKFDIKSNMTDDEIRLLLDRLQFIEGDLKGKLKTIIVPATETVEFILTK